MKQPPLRYVFFGTPRFAEIVLAGLIDAGIPPVALVANPDRPVGRKKIITPPRTKQLLHERGLPLPVFQPEKLDQRSIDELKALQPDLFVVAAYAQIIPQAVLDIPRLGTLGVHPSLLPKYRGASPIQSVILAGEPETGTTIYQMDAKMDHGPVLAIEAVPLDSLKMDYAALEEALAKLGAKLLTDLLPRVAEGAAQPKAQDEVKATFTKKFKTQDACIDPEKEPAEMLVRKVNAFSSEPGAWMFEGGKRIKVLKAEVRDGKFYPLLIQREGEKPTPPRRYP